MVLPGVGAGRTRRSHSLWEALAPRRTTARRGHPAVNLTCTQVLKTLKSVKGSPWSLSRGRRAATHSGLLWAPRVKGDWTLRAAAMVSTGSARWNMEPRISIFPGGGRRAEPPGRLTAPPALWDP